MSIPVATTIYVAVALVTTSLVPKLVESNPETALAVAAKSFWGRTGAFVISASALFSTGSAINSTLFSGSYFANNMANEDLVPDQIGDNRSEGVPVRTVLVLGALAATLAVLGSLSAISSFASVAFIVIFGTTNALALRHLDGTVSMIVTAAGAVGSAAFLPLLLWRLYTQEPSVFGTVAVITAVVVLAELVYFERSVIEREVEDRL